MLTDKLRKATSATVVEQHALFKETPPSIIGVIDDVLDARRVHLKFFRPSGLHGCKRQNIFHYTHAPSHPSRQDNRMMRILDNGSAVHEWVQEEYLSKHPEYWFVKEPKVLAEVEGVTVRGSCDGILIRRSDGYRWGLEFKTINHEGFQKLTGPQDKHVLQSSIYMALQKLHWITVVYWDKDKQNLREYNVPHSKELWERTKVRLREYKGFLDRDELPAYNSKACDLTFCNFVDHCRKMGAPI